MQVVAWSPVIPQGSQREDSQVLLAKEYQMFMCVCVHACTHTQRHALVSSWYKRKIQALYVHSLSASTVPGKDAREEKISKEKAEGMMSGKKSHLPFIQQVELMT